MGLTHACIPRCFRVLLHPQRREIILVIQDEPLPGFKHTQARRIPVTDSLVTAERTHWRPPTGDNGGTLRTGDAKHRIIDAGFATLQLQNHGPQTTHYRTVAGRFMASREASIIISSNESFAGIRDVRASLEATRAQKQDRFGAPSKILSRPER